MYNVSAADSQNGATRLTRYFIRNRPLQMRDHVGVNCRIQTHDDDFGMKGLSCFYYALSWIAESRHKYGIDAKPRVTVPDEFFKPLAGDRLFLFLDSCNMVGSEPTDILHPGHYWEHMEQDKSGLVLIGIGDCVWKRFPGTFSEIRGKQYGSIDFSCSHASVVR